MLDTVYLLAICLLVLGVVGSVVPLLPGAPTSLAGIYLYWWHTGYTEPGLFALVGLTLVGLTAMAFDYLGGAVAAKVSGASWQVSALAALVGFALLFVLGPLGIFVGVAGTVFAFEYRKHEDVDQSLKAAAYTTVGILASAALQFVLTAAMLVSFVLVT
ncbi:MULTISPECIES: DUF456 domain-containing protein [unclassified Haladaptatus]|uniref:DUF456 domain-containing protein n=1 Tax=unclassified Haladaptatus TaxID=2622732 RepID=UPI0023E78D21|nr:MULTISPECIES: DUF456 domain-containing protein [unclassified Haladaptatus]